MGGFNMEKSMLGFSKGSMHWIPNCRDSKHPWRCRTAGLLNPRTSSRFFLLTEQKGLVALPVFKLCRGCPSWSFSLLVPGTQPAVGKMHSEQSVLLFGRRKFDKQRILQFGFWRLFVIRVFLCGGVFDFDLFRAQPYLCSSPYWYWALAGFHRTFCMWHAVQIWICPQKKIESCRLPSFPYFG